MKRIALTLAFAAMIASSALATMAAGVPPAINLQGRLTDAAGDNVADGAYSVLFRIYDDTTGGVILWSETLPVQVNGGLFTVLVGKGTNFPADLFSSYVKYFLGITVSPEPELPRIPLTSVAYAFQSEDADVALLAYDVNCVGCVKAEDVDASGVQLRVTGMAPSGQYITGINENGTVTTATDAGADYTAGTGLMLSGTQFSIPPEGVTATEVAKDAVGAYQIAPGAVVGGLGGDIADNTISADDLGTSSVGTDEIASNAVGSAEIANDAVDWQEIATDAVAAPEIAHDGVGADEIIAGAVGTSEVANGSLMAVDLLDGPGVASDTGITGYTLSGGVETLLSQSIYSPAPGYVLAIATVSIGLTPTLFGGGVALGVSAAPEAFAPGLRESFSIPDAYPEVTLRIPVTVQGIFPVTGGTSHTFYFLGQKSSATGLTNAYNIAMSLVYFPTAYGSIVPAVMPSDAGTISVQGGEVRSALSENRTNPTHYQVAELISHQQLQEQIIADMGTRIEKLEEQLRRMSITPDYKK